jgi:hypothetical protein
MFTTFQDGSSVPSRQALEAVVPHDVGREDRYYWAESLVIFSQGSVHYLPVPLRAYVEHCWYAYCWYIRSTQTIVPFKTYWELVPGNNPWHLVQEMRKNVYRWERTE